VSRSSLLEADGLGFGYERGRPIFEGVGLELAEAEMAALIGPNGSGKTTLLKLLSGTLHASAGRITIGGEPLPRMKPRARARSVAVVPQDSSLVFDFTVMETVLMGRTPYLGMFGVESASDVAQAEEALRRTGMLRHADRLLSRLSGGERQLVLIARALAQRPRILLLDEPTAFLDIRHRLEVYELLVELNAAEGLTILTTSHDINLAARFCRRIILMKQGRILADGGPSEVFLPRVLSEVYDTPLTVLTDRESGLPYAVPPASRDGRPS